MSLKCNLLKKVTRIEVCSGSEEGRVSNMCNLIDGCWLIEHHETKGAFCLDARVQAIKPT